MWSIHVVEDDSALKRNEVLTHAATQSQLAHVLSERSQTRKITACMVAFS